jgi:sugar transferase (PEP-CTERM system associated)
MLRLFKQYYPIRNVFFIIGEGLFIFTSVLFASWIVIGFDSFAVDKLLWLKALLIAFFCFICLYYNDLYDLKITHNYIELGIRLLQALGAAAIFLALIYLIFPYLIIGRGIFLISTVFIIIFVVAWRVGYSVVLGRGMFDRKVIVMGSGDIAKKIIHEIEEKKDCGYSIKVVVSENKDTSIENSSGYKVEDAIYRSKYQGLCQISKETEANIIVVAIEEKRGKFPTSELLACRVDGIQILDGNSFYEMLTGKLIVKQINPGWLIFSSGFKKSRLRRLFKRVGDVALSLIMLIALSPLIILVALLIKLDSKGPVIFSQSRVGENRTNYKVHKFRSMVADAEKQTGPVWADAEDPRVTRIGKIIRTLRIDEVPQLWNVLKGEMSFVGPRPERLFFVEELAKQIPYYSERFSVKPGVTGWAQVCYPYGASVEDAIEKLNYDLFYIKNMSIFMDIMIIFRTVKIVLFGKGAR